MSSKIRDAMVAASKLTPKRGESDEEFITRVHYVVGSELPDAEWKALPGDVQDFNNVLAEAIDNKQPLPPFPDEVADTKPAGRRRGAAGATGVETFVPSIGAPVIITTKRGQTKTGIIVELTDTEVVINKKGDDGEKADDEEFTLANVTITAAPPVLNQASANEQAEAGKEDEPGVPQIGDTITVITARDRTITGNVMEIDESTDMLVLKDAAGADHELTISRLKSTVIKVRAKPVAGAAGAAAGPANKLGVADPVAPTTNRRRGAPAADKKAADKPADKPAEDTAAEKPNVGSIIRSVLVENPDATQDECEAALKKAGLPFSPVTVRVAYNTTQLTVKATIAHYVGE